MKKTILILCLLLFVSVAQASIVNNSTGSPGSEDSLSFTFFSLDSLGNPTTADSLYIIVTGPNGIIAFKDSMAVADSRITSTTIRGKQFYSFAEQVSNIDSSGSVGGYHLALIAKKNTGDLLTSSNYNFQIISSELSDQLALIGDSVFVKGGIIDTNNTDQGINDSTSIARWVWNTPQSGHTNSGSFGKYVDTEISGVSGSDSTSIARWVWNTPQSSHTSSGTFGKYVDTEISGVSGSDSTSIARWVWNTPQSSHTSSGTFGKYVDTEISGVSGGSGAYSFSLIVFDTSSSQTVSGANVVVRNITQSSLIAVGQTDSNGEIGFNLDADSFIVIAVAPGYTFEAYDTVVVSGAGTDTAVGYPFSVDPPSDPTVCRVWGYLRNFQGAAEVGATVAAFLPGGVVKYSEIIISPFAIASVTSSTGLFYLDLIPSSLLDPSDTKYEISIRRTDGTILRQRLLIPDQDYWRLTW